MTPYEQWCMLAMPKSQWRRRAREVIRSVLRGLTGDCPEHWTRETVLAFVDDAYPFGARSHHPYKAWLAERKLLIATLWPERATLEALAPTADDLAACEVAIDLVESGRDDEARKLLDEQAPRRLNRDCPACGSKRGEDCEEPPLLMPPGRHEWPIRIVPHLARVQPGGDA